MMSTIQNLKNFIRHGKQARQQQQHAEPTTKVASVHAQGQPHVDHRQQPHHGISEPADMDARHHVKNHANPGGDFSVNPVDQRNVAAKLMELPRQSRQRTRRYTTAREPRARRTLILLFWNASLPKRGKARASCPNILDSIASSFWKRWVMVPFRMSTEQRTFLVNGTKWPSRSSENSK